jgi:predicted esterase
MNAVLTALATSLFALSQSAPQESWHTELIVLLNEDDAASQEAQLAAILEYEPDWREVHEALRAWPYRPLDKRGLVAKENLCSDGVTRPYALYVPKSYDCNQPTPLLVALHGGVSRAELVEDPVAYAKETLYYALAEERGMLAIWPMGQDGATWWDTVGMDNIRDQILATKRLFNVDEDRVYMIGYSDGASAGFGWAMLDPTPFAAFFALSGHMGVTGGAGGHATFANNMANRPVYAVTSFDDSLYPSAMMRGVIDMAISAGARITYREQEGPHSFAYAEDEYPRIAAFLDRHPRDPLRPRIDWESASAEFVRCDWLELESVAADKKRADWHVPFNHTLTSTRITIGFVHDQELEGSGMRVASVTEESLATELGLAPGDVIVRADAIAIATSADLVNWKSQATRGKDFEFEVERDGERRGLTATLPEAETYELFDERPASGRIRAAVAGNRVTITTSRVGALSILVDPDLFRLEREVTVTIDGKESFRGLVEADLEFMLRNYLAARDRRLLPVARLHFDL